jgi:hypothetical protein
MNSTSKSDHEPGCQKNRAGGRDVSGRPVESLITRAWRRAHHNLTIHKPPVLGDLDPPDFFAGMDKTIEPFLTIFREALSRAARHSVMKN